MTAQDKCCINQVTINQFRNLIDVNIEPYEKINAFFGSNGSGKTSFLEAIYFLGLGRSFRTRGISRILNHAADQFYVSARLQQSQTEIPLGIEHHRQGDKKIRINGEAIKSLAPLAQALPLQLLTTESHRYFQDGPKQRRQFLDWGVFHVEPLFYPQWLRYQKALSQRNAALKKKLPNHEISVWDHEIVKLAHAFENYRQAYVDHLQPTLSNLLKVVLQETDLELRLSRGWTQGKTLSEALIDSLVRDRLLGYTQHGPHRADLQLYAGKTPAGDYLSQGQQKVAAYALHLAQGILLKKLTGRSPIYLIDDLPSELDAEKRAFLAQILHELDAQAFITGISLEELRDITQLNDAKVFHVEHGKIADSVGS